MSSTQTETPTRVISIVGCEATVEELFTQLGFIRGHRIIDEAPTSTGDQLVYEDGKHVATFRTTPGHKDDETDSDLELVRVDPPESNDPPDRLNCPVFVEFARWELRDAVDQYLSAAERIRMELNACKQMTPNSNDKRLVVYLSVHAIGARDEAELRIKETLATLWGFWPAGRPWTPCGAIVSSGDGAFVYISPGERDGVPDYQIKSAKLTVIEESNFEDDAAWQRFLSNQPGRYVDLSAPASEPVTVVDPDKSRS